MSGTTAGHGLGRHVDFVSDGMDPGAGISSCLPDTSSHVSGRHTQAKTKGAQASLRLSPGPSSYFQGEDLGDTLLASAQLYGSHKPGLSAYLASASPHYFKAISSTGCKQDRVLLFREHGSRWPAVGWFRLWVSSAKHILPLLGQGL